MNPAAGRITLLCDAVHQIAAGGIRKRGSVGQKFPLLLVAATWQLLLVIKCASFAYLAATKSSMSVKVNPLFEGSPPFFKSASSANSAIPADRNILRHVA